MNPGTLPRLLAASLASMLCSCSLLHPAYERNFLSEGRSGIVLEGVKYHPGPSQTGFLPAMKALTDYWNLNREARRIWNRHPPEEELLTGAPREELLTTLAQLGIWLNLDALDEHLLTERLRSKIPVVIFQSPEALQPTALRARLLLGFRDGPREYLLSDTHRGGLIQSREAFCKLNQNAMNLCLILCPGSRVNWNRTPSETRALAEYHERRDEWSTARELWETMLRNQPDDSPVLVRIGNARLQENQTLLAEQRYREAIQADEKNAAAYNNLAYILAKRKPEEAERLARQAHALHPDDPGVLDTLAFTLMQLDRPEEASAWLERSRPGLRSRPLHDQIAILTRLAESYAQSGNDHLVSQVLDQLFTLKPDFRVPAELLRFQKPHHPVRP